MAVMRCSAIGTRPNVGKVALPPRVVLARPLGVEVDGARVVGDLELRPVALHGVLLADQRRGARGRDLDGLQVLAAHRLERGEQGRTRVNLLSEGGPADSTNSATRIESLRTIRPPHLRLVTVLPSAADVRVVSWRVRRLRGRLRARPHHHHVAGAEAASTLGQGLHVLQCTRERCRSLRLVLLFRSIVGQHRVVVHQRVNQLRGGRGERRASSVP